MHKKFGNYAFLVVLALAIITGLFKQFKDYQNSVFWVLIILGFIVGLLNITKKESESFLIASIALLLFTAVLPADIVLRDILDNIAAFVAPGALIVSLKVIYELEEKK